MATLEKIRSKSVLLIVIIGVALLAFIVGDALTNSRNLFGDHTTVAKVGGSKIDISEYQQKREELNRRLEEARQQNPQQFANFDTQVLAQMAIDELIGTRLLDESVEKLGIRTSPEQLRFYVLENPVNQQGLSAIMRQLQAVGVNVTTPAQAYDVIFNPTRNGLTEAQAEPFKRAWVAMEQETARMIKRNTYQRLVYSTVKANDLDRKALYNDFVNLEGIVYGQPLHLRRHDEILHQFRESLFLGLCHSNHLPHPVYHIYREKERSSYVPTPKRIFPPLRGFFV